MKDNGKCAKRNLKAFTIEAMRQILDKNRFLKQEVIQETCVALWGTFCGTSVFTWILPACAWNMKIHENGCMKRTLVFWRFLEACANKAAGNAIFH